MQTARLLTVSPMHCAGGGAWSQRDLLGWGVPGPRGVSARGLPGPGGVCLGGGGAWSRGICSRGVSALGGGVVSQHALRQTPPCIQNSWHTLMKILPCPKFRLRVVKTNFSLPLKLICTNCYIWPSWCHKNFSVCRTDQGFPVGPILGGGEGTPPRSANVLSTIHPSWLIFWTAEVTGLFHHQDLRNWFRPEKIYILDQELNPHHLLRFQPLH